MITTAASAVQSAQTTTNQQTLRHSNQASCFHQLWKVPFTEYKDVHASELGINRFRKAIASMMALLEAVNRAYLENMNIAYLLSLIACHLNGLDYQSEAEILHRRALCIGIRCIGGNNPLLADSMEWLAFSLYRQGNCKEALYLCMSAFILLQSSFGRQHPYTGNCFSNLNVVLEKRDARQHREEIPRETKVSTQGLQSLYPIHPIYQNKEPLVHPREHVTRAAVVYSPYLINSGFEGLSVS